MGRVSVMMNGEGRYVMYLDVLVLARIVRGMETEMEPLISVLVTLDGPE